MNANWLLLWMSARQEGSWAQFRSAVEELRADEDDDQDDGEEGDDADQNALPIYQAVRFNMQRLGHAEFFGRLSWRVAPPTLAITASPIGARGVLAGARSNRLLASVRNSLGAVRLETCSMPGAPDLIRLSADGEPALAAAANAACLFVQRDAPVAILQSLPTIGDPTARRPAKFPVGADWRVERFDEDKIGWAGITRREAERTASGLFRFSFGYQRLVFWRYRTQSWTVPVQVAKYIALKKRRRHILRYDGQAAELRVPVSCRPPFLIERGLIACSGVLPTIDPGSGLLCYPDVPITIARLAAGLLEQEFRR